MKNPERDPGQEIKRLAKINRELTAANHELTYELAAQHEALERRALDFRLVVDSIPVPVAVTTPTAEIETLNQATLDYFGLTLDQLKGWTGLEVVHPDDLERTVSEMRAAHARGQSYNVESRHRRADGVYRWFNVLGLPLRDADGTILRWFHLLIDIDDRKRTEETLQLREREAQSMMNGIPVGATVLDSSGEVEFVNKDMLDYFGRSLEEHKAWKTTGAEIHPDDFQRVLARVQHSLATGTPHETDQRLRRHDGVYRWFEVRARPLRAADASITRWHVVYIDIDDRKRAEAELRRASDSFADAQRLSHTGSFITDLLADDHNWSDEAFRIFEFEPETEITVARIREIIHSDDLASFDDTIARGAAGADVNFEFRIITHGGMLKHVRGAAHVVERVAGRPLFVGALQDVTESKLTENALRRSEAFLAEGQRLSRTGTFAWRTDTNEIVFSEELYRIFEINPTSTLTLDLIVSRVHPLDVPLVAAKIEHARGGGQDLDYTVRLQMPDGRVKHVQTFAHSSVDGHGGREILGAMLDITQLRLAEEALDEVRSELALAARAMSLGVLTASIAHEVNQPLSGIVTNANTCLRMLGCDPPNLEGARETARRTIRDGNRASEIIVRLRALFGRKEFAAECVDLNAAAREVIALSSHELHRHGVTLQTDFDEDLPPIRGDRVQIQQVIINLLLNASDAIQQAQKRTRRIRVTTQHDDAGCVQLNVQDSGIGLPDGGETKLFEAFYTTKPDGMGIGLSVSRSIIERHRGRLWASPNHGGGATFSFSLPCLAPHDQSPDLQPTQD